MRIKDTDYGRLRESIEDSFFIGEARNSFVRTGSRDKPTFQVSAYLPIANAQYTMSVLFLMTSSADEYKYPVY